MSHSASRKLLSLYRVYIDLDLDENEAFEIGALARCLSAIGPDVVNDLSRFRLVKMRCVTCDSHRIVANVWRYLHIIGRIATFSFEATRHEFVFFEKPKIDSSASSCDAYILYRL